MDDSTDAPAPGPLTRLRQFLHGRRQRMSDQQRAAVVKFLDDRCSLSAATARHFVVLSLLSSAIAAMGLLLDSSPAVIGAMLLGPFITPLLGIAGSLIQGWGDKLVRASTMVMAGVGLSLTSSFMVGLIFARHLGPNDLPSLLLALTRPGLLDLGIALLAGVAAGYATMRTDAAGALSGVAVSVTLEPPLAAMGLFLASRDGADLSQTLLTFVTNFGALVCGATIAMIWWGFADSETRGTSRQANLGVALWIAAVMAVAVPLGVYSRGVVRNSLFEDDVVQIVRDWDPSVRVVHLDATVSGGKGSVKLDLTGPRSPEPAWKLAELIAQRRNFDVSVDMTFTQIQEQRAVSRD